MNKKVSGYILFIVGVIIAVIALAADSLGIGHSSGIGWHQLLLAAIGIVVAIIGIWMALSKTEQKQ